MSVNSKMTALADEIRELSGTEETIGLDAMKTHVNEANTDVATEADLIEQIANALEGKAAGSGASSSVATCTVEIVNKTIGGFMESYIFQLWLITYENGELKGYGADRNMNNYNIIPDGFDWYAEKNTINNVVCGSMMVIYDDHDTLSIPNNLYINPSIDPGILMIPLTPNVTHTITLEAPW